MSFLQESAEEWFASLNLVNEEALFVYGIDFGYDYEVIRPWLKEDRRRYLIFVEDDLEISEAFVKSERGKKILQDPQVRLWVVKKEQELDILAHYYALCPIYLSALRAYAKKRSEVWENLRQALELAFYKARTEASQDLNPNRAYYKNFYKNIRAMERDFIAESFFGLFPKMPAILCGAGPSLEEAIAPLREMKDRALLFAGGSALTALGAHGIRPHFGAALSPGKAEHDRLFRANLFEVPLFYSPRVSPEALKVWGGERMAVLGSGPPLASWLAKEIGFQGVKTQEGPGAMGLLLELAYQMGCDPITFVGVDLSAKGGKLYATGVEAIESPEGSEVIWVAEAKGLGEMVKARQGPLYLNASGGRAIPHVQKGTLKPSDFPLQDLEGQVKALLEEHRPSPYKEKVQNSLNQLKESLEHALEILEKMSNKLKVLAKEAFKHLFTKPPVNKALQATLEQEIAYPLILEEMVLARSVYLKRVYDDFLAAAGRTPQLRSQRFVSIEQERVQFLQEAVTAQLSLLNSP